MMFRFEHLCKKATYEAARYGATAGCSGFHRSHAEYQVISDYSDTSNDESRSTGVTNLREVLLIPDRVLRGHTTRGHAHTHTHTHTHTQPEHDPECHYDRRTAGAPRCVKSHDTGRGRRERGGKIDGTEARGVALQRDHFCPWARARAHQPNALHENPQRRPVPQWPRRTLGLFPLLRLGEDG